MAVAMPIVDAAALFRDAGLKVVETGLEHGTVTVVAEGEAIEVTQTRVDLDTDGRHATVAFSDDWRADAARRDFTVNALYVTADGAVERSRSQQNRIANHFRLNPFGGISPEQRRVCIVFHPLRIRLARLPEGIGHHE